MSEILIVCFMILVIRACSETVLKLRKNIETLTPFKISSFPVNGFDIQRQLCPCYRRI